MTHIEQGNHQAPTEAHLEQKVSMWEEGLEDGTVDWNAVQPSSTLLEMRQDLVQWLQQSDPGWSPGQVARTAAKIELSWKADRLGRLRDERGEADPQVLALEQDITYWQQLLTD